MQNKLFQASRQLIGCLMVIVTASACSFPGVYKINVQQGNIVTQEMLDQLRPGMNKRQVHFVLGNPVLNNVFDEQTETYFYSYQQAGGETSRQKVIVYYSDGLFDRYEGTVLEDQPAY